MSDNVHNINVPVPQDPNTYNIEDLKIEFLKTYKIEYNEFLLNRLYSYAPLADTDGSYQKTEFMRKDPLTFVKLKGKDVWLHEINNKLFFDKIKSDLYTTKDPLVLWIEYPRENECYLYTLRGYGQEHIIKKTYDKLTNIAYLNYKQVGDQIYMNWVDDVNSASKFHFRKIHWGEISWIKLHDKKIQRKLLGR